MKNTDIRVKLKEAGFSSRKVSVREMNGTMNSTFILTVHDPDVSILEIRELTDAFKEIERDRSGDLMSGNTFIIVERNREHPVKTANIMKNVEKALKQVLLEPDSSWENIPVEINGRTYYLNKMDSHRPNLCGPRAENIEKGLIGNRWVKQVQNPEDSEDPKNAFEEAAETIAQRIAENELDIGYINRNAKKNEVNK